MSRVEPNTSDTSSGSGRPAPYLLDVGRAFTAVVDGEPRELDIYSEEGFRVLSNLWLRAGWQQKFSYELTWLGIPIIQLPEDVVLMHELLWKVRPDVVVECGVAHGGALVLYASVLELLGKGQVVGVDVEIRKYNRLAIESHALSHRITLIEGDSVAATTLQEVRSHIRPRIGCSSCSTPYTLASTLRQSSRHMLRSSPRRATSSSSTESCPWLPTLRAQVSTGRPTTRSSPSTSSSRRMTRSNAIRPTAGWGSRTARRASFSVATD